MNWFYKRLLQRGGVWTNGIQRITVHMDDRSLTVRLFSDREARTGIHLYTSFQQHWREGWSVRIDELNRGCCADLHWGHGIGTVVMNLAVQCIRLRFADESGAVTVNGEAVPDPGSLEDRQRNYAFWSRFGLYIEDTEAVRSPMSCQLRELNLIDKGDVYGGIPSLLSIRAFVVEVNEDYCLESDCDVISEHERSALARDVPSEKHLYKLEHEVERQHARALTVMAICLVAIVVLVFGISAASLFGGSLLTTGVVMTVSRLGWLRDTSEAAKRLKQERDVREYRLDELRKQLAAISERHPGSLHRLIGRYGAELPDISPRHQCAAEKMFRRVALPDCDVELLAQVVSALAGHRKLLRVMPSAADYNDFIFGDRCQTMSEYELRGWSDVLGSEFSFHIERLLGEIGCLRVYGSTSTNVDALAGLADHVGFIEFYRDIRGGYTDLSASVHLRHGVIDFSCIWSAWKDLRAHEAGDVLSQLESFGLLQKTYIRWNGRDLSQISQGAPEAMKDILVLLNTSSYTEDNVSKWFRGGRLQLV